METAHGILLGPLERMIGFMIRVVQVQIFRQYYEEFRYATTTTGELSLLLALSLNPGIRQGALGDAMRIKRSNMTKIVQSLHAEGYIRRESNGEDRRSVALYLTAKGVAAVDRLQQEALEHDARATAVLSANERKELLRLLGKLYLDQQRSPTPEHIGT
jgi:DNA-binding MarR family transcriptional regulator